MLNSKAETMSLKTIELPSLTVVMPCLNEEGNIMAAIQLTVEAFDKYGIDGELIVINDGSTDSTAERVKECMALDNRIRLLSHEWPQGIGSSFWGGVHAARNEFVTMIPGDNEIDPRDSLTYYYMSKDTDIIVPFIHNVEVRSVSRRVISSLYRLIINMSFGMNLNYTNGTVIYNTTVLREIDLTSVGFFYQAEILIRLIRSGYLYAETPHFLSRRLGGETKAITLKSFFDVAKAYLQLVWNMHVLRKVGAKDARIHPSSATYRRMKSFVDNT